MTFEESLRLFSIILLVICFFGMGFSIIAHYSNIRDHKRMLEEEEQRRKDKKWQRVKH